jgi:hypothetical protein
MGGRKTWFKGLLSSAQKSLRRNWLKDEKNIKNIKKKLKN